MYRASKKVPYHSSQRQSPKPAHVRVSPTKPPQQKPNKSSICAERPKKNTRLKYQLRAAYSMSCSNEYSKKQPCKHRTYSRLQNTFCNIRRQQDNNERCTVSKITILPPRPLMLHLLGRLAQQHLGNKLLSLLLHCLATRGRRSILAQALVERKFRLGEGEDLLFDGVSTDERYDFNRTLLANSVSAIGSLNRLARVRFTKLKMGIHT